MALTYKIQDDGTPQPMGDTQGILIPSNARFCRGALINPGGSIPADTRTVLKFTRQMGEDWFDSDGNLVVPVGGVYTMHLFFRTTDATLKTLDLQFVRGYSSTSTGNLSFSISGSDYVSAGTKTDFASVTLSASKAYTAVSSYLTVIMLQQVVPDIVANKGVLVSGGAFQFDVDGNGYTDNYSTDEVKVGVWHDGKPVYKKSFVMTTSVTFAASTWTTVPGSVSPPNLYRIIRGELARMTNGVHGSFPVGIESDAGAIKCYPFTASPACLAGSVVTIWYTKTTD